MNVLVGILTCEKTSSLASACLDTWIKEINPPHNFFFACSKSQVGSSNHFIDCQPDGGEKRFLLPEKVYKMFSKALDFSWDFFYKCDDDTYLNFNRYLDYIKTLDPKKDLYIGRRVNKLNWNKFKSNLYYAQGGAGYTLSRSSMEKCLPILKNICKDRSKNMRAEDYSVSYCLSKSNISLTHNPLFHTRIAGEDQSSCEDAILKFNSCSTHYVAKETFYKIHKQLNKL